MLKYLLLLLLPCSLQAQSNADKAKAILEKAKQVHLKTRLYEFENTYIKKYPNEDSVVIVSLCRLERLDTNLQFAFMAEQHNEQGKIIIYDNDEWRIHVLNGQTDYAYTTFKQVSSSFNFTEQYFGYYANPKDYFDFYGAKNRHYEVIDTTINKEKYHKVRVSYHIKFDLAKPAPDSIIHDLIIHAKNASIHKVSSQYLVFGQWYYDSRQIKKVHVSKSYMAKLACKDCKVKYLPPPTDRKEQVIHLDANIALKKLDKSTQTIAAVEGKYKFIYFWYLRCAPCMLSKPAIHDLIDKYQSKGVAFIGVNTDPEDKIKTIEKNLKEHHLDMLTFYDAMQYAEDSGVESYPSFVILDANNKIVHTQHGYSEVLVAEISEQLDKLLAQ